MNDDTSPEYVGDLAWMGCPSLRPPRENAKPVRDQAMRAFVLRLVKVLEDGRVAPAMLIEKPEVLACDFYEDVTRETRGGIRCGCWTGSTPRKAPRAPRQAMGRRWHWSLCDSVSLPVKGRLLRSSVLLVAE